MVIRSPQAPKCQAKNAARLFFQKHSCSAVFTALFSKMMSIIIFSLHLSCLIASDFESSKAVDSFVEVFDLIVFNLNDSKNNDTEGSLEMLSLLGRDITEFK